MRVTEARKAGWQNGVIRNIDWNDIKRTHANDDFLFAQQYVIVSCMEKTILIAGKDLPYGGDFADGMALAGYNVVVTGNPESDGAAVTAGDIVIASWNRPSSVSARSLVLQAENAFTVIDETVLYFDAAVYAQQFTALSPEECTRAIDTMISGYHYLTMEILSRIEQRKESGKLIYIVRHHPSMADVIRSSAIRSSTASAAGPFVSSAEAAFTAFAENIAAYAGDKQNVSVVLVSCDVQNDAAEKDGSLASWLADYLAALDGAKSRRSAKQSLSWIKAGSKAPGSLGQNLLSRFR